MANSFMDMTGLIKKKLKNSRNSDYWIKKISRNISIDNEIDKEISALGWTVIHFCGKYILKHTDECVKYIEEIIFEQEIDNNFEEDFSLDDL